MKTKRPGIRGLASLLLIALVACGGDAGDGPPASPQQGQQGQQGGQPPEMHEAAHGPPIELGKATIGGRTVRAARDQGEVPAGGEVPVDVWVEGGGVDAVRFWIGAEDARGSRKARASVEDPGEPDHWHTHVEAPAVPGGDAKLWVELEVGGRRSAGSFELKR